MDKAELLTILESVSAYSEVRNSPEALEAALSLTEDIAKYQALLVEGLKWFEEGYRCATTGRHVYGHAVVETGVPDGALIYRKVAAGYSSAGSPCYRFEYLYKIEGKDE